MFLIATSSEMKLIQSVVIAATPAMNLYATMFVLLMVLAPKPTLLQNG